MTVLLMQNLETADHWHCKSMVVVLSGTHKAYCLLLHTYSIYLHFLLLSQPLYPARACLPLPSALYLFSLDDNAMFGGCVIIMSGADNENDVSLLKILKSSVVTCGLKCLKY
jgi:hypothetical protein